MAKFILTEELALERINEILKEPFNKDLEFLGFVGEKWTGYKTTKMIVKCNAHNTINEIWYSNFYKHRKYRCKECIKEDLGNRRRRSEEDSINNLNKILKDNNSPYYVNRVIKEEGVNPMDSYVEVICPKHGPFNKGHSLRCPNCEVELRKNLALKQINESLARINNREDRDISFLGFVGNYENESSRLKLHCNIHNTTWDTTNLNNFTRNHFAGGCEVCKNFSIGFHEMESKTEKFIKKYYNKEIDLQKKFSVYDDICNKDRTLFVDFYLPEDNIIIEYDGEQHYKWVKLFQKTYEDYVDQVNRDNCLIRYCKENNIRLLRIPWKNNNNLEDVVREFLVMGNDIAYKINPILNG
jgi:very-short-patch-repair endonuclease